MRMKRLVMLALMVSLAGCSTERLNLPVADAVSREKTAKIIKGVTTKEEVEAIFGKPLDRLIFPYGEKWFYKDFNLNPIHIEFDEIGVVKDYLTDE
jgi:outer membrane protein assembly factor BamE (lipoprotein component of BamABCDE complex)